MPSPEERPVSNPLYPSWRNPWVILAAVLVAAFILFAAATAHVARTQTTVTRRGATWFTMRKPGVAGRMQVTNGSIVQGVITAANGSALTIAGNGTTSTVTTTSSTKYQGATSAAINDTVVVSGTSSNGTITASRIVVNP